MGRGADRRRRDGRPAPCRAGRRRQRRCSSTRLRGGLAEPAPQMGEPTYAAKIDPAELRIDWRDRAVEIDRLVRVGGAWTTLRGSRVEDSTPPTDRATVDWCRRSCSPRASAPMAFADWRKGARLRRRRVVRMSAERRPASVASTRCGGSRATAPTPTSCCGRDARSSRALRSDRQFATDLVYGTTRMRRACDALLDRFSSGSTRRGHAHAAATRRLPARVRAASHRTPPSVRRSRWRPKRTAGSSTPCFARSRRPARCVAVRAGAAQLSGLARGPPDRRARR